MSEETLHSAARRVARCCRIDEAHGGLMSIETLQALNTLDIQLGKARERETEARSASYLAVGVQGVMEVKPS